jgi:hypothetical protein
VSTVSVTAPDIRRRRYFPVRVKFTIAVGVALL